MEIIESKEAPKAIGPYSQGIKVRKHLWLSGQLGIDLKTGELVSGGIQEQTHQVLLNLEAVLRAAKMDFSHVVKTTAFLTDMAHFAEFNKVYEEHFGPHKPARSTVAVAGLPRKALVEIELIAVLE